MRKLGYILSTALYLMLTIGVSLNSHYCGGRLLETYVYTTPECPFCDFRDMDTEHEKDKDCCDDETDFFVVVDSQQVIQKLTVDSRVNLLLYEAWKSSSVIHSFNFSDLQFTYDDTSPPQPDEDLVTLYSSYIYYG